jgi:hypothetical protein
MSQGLRDVALSNARLPKQQHVLSAFEKSASGKVECPFRWDLWVEMEVEVLERLLVLEVRSAHSLIELLCIASFDFVLTSRYKDSS